MSSVIAAQYYQICFSINQATVATGPIGIICFLLVPGFFDGPAFRVMAFMSTASIEGRTTMSAASCLRLAARRIVLCKFVFIGCFASLECIEKLNSVSTQVLGEPQQRQVECGFSITSRQSARFD